MTNRRRLFLAAMVWGALSTPVSADLLDEEEEPSVQPSKDVQPAPQATRTPAKENPKPAPKAGGGGGQAVGETPMPTPSTANQTVLSPKNPGKKPPAGKDREPVHFESKGLKGLREKGTVELVDDVVVTQGHFRLEADHAQVYFDEVAKDVVKVVADGNVKIFNLDANTGEKLKAYGDRVLFLNKDRVVIMEGNARLWRGEDSMIRGKKITYEMDTGWIRADRVAGELNPTDKDQKK